MPAASSTASLSVIPVGSPTITDDAITRILELARWAPSGDNAQPWRFQRLAGEEVRIDTRDQSQECIYERDGRCGLIAIGMLLETVRLAATTVGRLAEIIRLPGGNPRAPTFVVTFRRDASMRSDPLAGRIRERVVHRGPYATRALRLDEIALLEQAVGPGFRLHIAGGRSRWRWARLNQRAAILRLDTREGWELTKQIIEWDASFSADRIPDQATGVPRFMLGMVRHQLSTWSWERTHFMNRYLGGTLAPRMMLEWWPGMRCAAHLALHAVEPDDSPDGWLRAGAAIQRLWLQATALGLRHQPSATPLVFARYARDGLVFSQDPRAISHAHNIADEVRRLLGADALERVVWMGRIGEAPPPSARSTRLDLSVLCVPKDGA